MTTVEFTYLGVKITPELNIITSANYNPLEKVTETLNCWSTLPISMIGQINLIKILQQFLYYFQTLPLPLSEMFYNKPNKPFSKFIWNDRRTSLNLLYLPYERGGLQFPNLRWYYRAAQLASAAYYFCTTTSPTWVCIERESIPLPLSLYMYSSGLKTLKICTKNPLIKNTMVWYASHKHIL